MIQYVDGCKFYDKPIVVLSSMNETIKLEPSNIREVWDSVRPGIEELCKTWPDVCTWRPEDIYAAVIAEEAILYANDDGFFVCALEIDRYTQRTDLLIWIAYGYEEKRGDLLKTYWPSFIEVAKRLGCKGVVARSNLPGLNELATPLYTKYRVNVDG